jgi:hypothetical protein
MHVVWFVGTVGLLTGFALGVGVARYWPRTILFSDYVLLRNETKRIEGAVNESTTALHTRFDQMIAVVSKKL